jgi:hypothetical protein
LNAQAPKPAPDSLVFVNGEQLSGTLVKATHSGITFKSFMVGEITVPWTNIKELHSSQTFAEIKVAPKLTRSNALAQVPEGTVSVESSKLAIATPTATVTVPLADVDLLLSKADFDAALKPSTWSTGWAGTAAGGVSLVRSTSDSTTFNGSIALSRSTPGIAWLPARTKTSFTYAQSYGSTSQAGDPTVKTNIFHSLVEQDEFVSPKFFALLSATFDHNLAASLSLQQAYGVGLGVNILKNAKQSLDVKADIHYEKQSIAFSTNNIIGSTFSESWLRNLPRKLVLTEFGSVTPAFNDPSAFSTHVNAALGFPVYKGLGFGLSGVDDYLNNAPAGSKKNSTQFGLNLTYTIKPR